MKTIPKILIAVVVCLMISPPTLAEVIIDPSAAEGIRQALRRPAKVFHLDEEKNRIVFERLDKWFSKHVDEQDAKKSREKDVMGTVYEIESARNVPIPASAAPVRGLENKAPFRVWYLKEPRERTFMKDLRVPTKTRLDEKQVAALGREFITRNAFCETGEKDKLVSQLVTSRMRRSYEPDMREGDESTLFQRVVFERQFDGLEVINSRQIVDIHPDSREVLSYKSINWTPADETSGKHVEYISEEDVAKRIAEALGETKAPRVVEDVEMAMYQAKDMLLPVLVVHSRKATEQNEVDGIKRDVIISLVEGLEIGTKQGPMRRPSAARK